MGGSVVRCLVMRCLRVRSGLMMDRLGMGRGLMMNSLGMGRGLVLLCSRMCSGRVMLCFRMCSGPVMLCFRMCSGPVMLCFGMRSSLMMDRLRVCALGMCRSPWMFVHWVRTGRRPDHGARLTVINRKVLIAIIASLLLLGALRRSCLEMMIMGGRFLGGSRSGIDPTRTVEADAIVCRSIIDYCTILIGIVDDSRIHPPNRSVITEDISLPPPSVETRTIITEAIIDSPVESNVRAPITVVPMIIAVAKTPIPRGPKVSRLRYLHPRTRNPEITIVSIGPVARTPKISVLRTRRLLIGYKGRRRDCDRDILGEKRDRGEEEAREENISGGFHQVQHRLTGLYQFVNSQLTWVEDWLLAGGLCQKSKRWRQTEELVRESYPFQDKSTGIDWG
jgi:hypothetical protein